MLQWLPEVLPVLGNWAVGVYHGQGRGSFRPIQGCAPNNLALLSLLPQAVECVGLAMKLMTTHVSALRANQEVTAT